MTNNPNDPKNKDYDPDIDLDDSAFEYDDVDPEFEASGDEDLLENEQDWQEEEPKNKKASRGKRNFSRSDKKGMSFNTMVIIGAVVLGGGVLVFNVMNQSGKQAQDAQGSFQSSMSVSGVIDGALNPADNPSAPVAPEAADTATAPQQDSAASTDGGFLNEGLGELADGVPNDGTSPPQPAPVAPADMAAPAEDVVTPLPAEQTTVIDVADSVNAPQEIQIAPVTPVIDQPAVDSTTQIDVSSQNSPEMNIVPEPTADAVPNPVTPAADSAAMAQLEEKLSAILSRMEKIESDMADIRSGQSGNIKELEKTVMSLKKDLAQAKQAPAPKKEAAPSKPKEPKVAKSPVIEPYPKVALPKPAPAKKPAESVTPQTAPVAVSEPKPAPAQTVSNGAWELRAAQPGRAWVSRAGDRDMQSIELGQTLKGVGTITAIEYQNGRWVVRGTEGQITQ